MNWSSFSELWRACVHFFQMGGYGFYIWGSYGVTLILLGSEVLMLLKRKRRLSRIPADREQLKTQNPKLETAL